MDDGGARVMDVVNSFRLEKTEFDKKSYLTSLKGTPGLTLPDTPLSKLITSI